MQTDRKFIKSIQSIIIKKINQFLKKVKMTSQVNIFQSANNIEIEINYVTVMKYALNTEFKKIGGRWNKDLKVWVFEKKCSTVLNHLFDSKNLKTTIIKQNKNKRS